MTRRRIDRKFTRSFGLLLDEKGLSYENVTVKVLVVLEIRSSSLKIQQELAMIS